MMRLTGEIENKFVVNSKEDVQDDNQRQTTMGRSRNGVAADARHGHVINKIRDSNHVPIHNDRCKEASFLHSHVRGQIEHA